MRKDKKNKTHKPSVAKKLFKSFVFGFFAIVAGLLLAGLATIWLFYAVITPSANEVLSHQFPTSSKIYARDGTLLYEVYGEVKRDPVALATVPKQLQNATIAIEDKNFYNHGAVSFRDIARAIWINYKTGGELQGASTITQQYVKNAVLSPQKTFYRKIVEAIVGQKIESKVSKDAILELYLNTIPYGRNAYGVATASREFFGKEVGNLSLAESAYLASMPQAPSFYDPLGPNREALDHRKDEVLKDMRDQGYITAEDFDKASQEKVTFIERQKSTIIAPYFVFWIEQQLSQKYGQGALQTQGLKIYTSLDLHLQDIAEKVIKAHAEINSKKYNAYNAGLVAVDPKTGQVLAMVGGKDYFALSEPANCKSGRDCLFEPNVNVATSARQPGSSFKVYTYLTAFGKDYGFSPASLIVDSPVTYNGYSPKNYNGGYHGRTSIRKALAGSLNVPAVKMLNEIGIDSVVNAAHSMGITAPLQNCGLSLTLGSCEIKLLDHVSAYSTIANGGILEGTCGIIKAVNLKGDEIEKCPMKNKEIADSQAVFELESIMTDNDSRTYIFGKNTPLAFKDRKVAAKTGTTDIWRDGWTVGFTPSLAAGVWAGNNDNTPMRANSDGIFVAAPAWRDFMDQALAGTPAEEFPQPESIKELKPSDVPGSLKSQYVFTKKTDFFADYAVPKVKPPKPKPIPPPVVVPPVAVLPAPVKTLQVNIVQPSAFATISDYPYNVAVEVSDPSQVAHVELYIDGRFLQTLTSGPFTFSVGKSEDTGVHTLMAIVTDLAGRTSSDSVSVSLTFERP